MIGTIDVKVQAHNPNFPLEPVFTFINSAQSFRIRNVPRAIGKWNITKVFIHLNYPDNTTVQKECVLNGNIWIGTVEGCATSGTSTNGFYVTASGIDENENVITNYVLGAGDLYVKDLDGTIDPERVGTKMYFNDTIPTNPKKGDATFIDGVLNVYDGTNWTPVAEDPDLSNYYTKTEVDEALGEVEESIPTKTSDLTNDSGFITSSAIPTNVSSFNNDAGYITLAQVPTPSYIQDADGRKIEADLDCITQDLTLPWTLVDGADTYTLNYAEQSGKWLYEEAETKKIELTYTAENSLWELSFYVWNNGEWQYNTGSTTTQEEDATSLSILEWTLTRSILKNGKLATHEEVETGLASKQNALSEGQMFVIQQALNDEKTTLVFETAIPVTRSIEQYDLRGELTHDMIAPLINSSIQHYLTHIYIGNGITSIGEDAFAGYHDDVSSAAKTIYIPKSVKEIKARAFYNTHQLGYFYIDDGLLQVGEQAFYDCYNLRAVNFPNTVYNIASNAFGGTYSDLDTIMTNSTVQDMGITFRNTETYPNNYPFGMENTDYISLAHTASKEWVLADRFRFREGTISRVGRRPPYSYACGLKNNTTTVLEITESSTTAFRVVPDNYGANYTNADPNGGRREMYFVLILGEGVTRPMTWYAPTVVDKFQGGSEEAIAPESGKMNIYHVFEYQEGHFAVEKQDWLENHIPTKTSDLTNDSGFITTTALTPYREKSDLYYEHSFSKTNWQNVPRFIMDYDGTQTIFDKFDSTLNRWNVSTGTSDWYVQESLTGMDADPQFTLTKLGSGVSNILPTEGAGTTTVSFIDMDIEGTFTMDMSDQLVCKVYVDRQISALEARIAALENNNQ